MPALNPALVRAEAFARAHGLQMPILLAPMAGACPPSLSIAVANAGGLGSCGALLMQPEAIKAWAAEVRAGEQRRLPAQSLDSRSAAAPRRGARRRGVRAFLATGDREVAPEAGDATPPDFAAQCEAMLEAAPPIVSSIMGLYPAGLRRDA